MRPGMTTCALMMVALLAGCQGQEAVPTLAALPAVQPKLLATVAIPPTPNEAERQATRLAQVPTPGQPTPTPEPSPTVYVGVFLEGVLDEDVPLVDATRAVFMPDSPTLVSRCRFAVADDIFGSSWRSNSGAVGALGCAVEDVQVFGGSVQVFERGVMYYQQGGSLWAITTEGGVRGDRYWSLAELPESEPGQNPPPPPGLLPPGDSFSAMWRAVPDLRDRLGFARLGEQQANLSLQRFENGALLADRTSGLVYILLGSSIAFGPYS
jgi:hypothetical protein